MSIWDKMDKKHWKDSEVMQEFEKTIIRSTQELALDLEKKANMENVPKDLAKINQEAGPAATNLKNVADAVEKMYEANDGEVAEEKEEVTASLLEELEKLAFALADEGDTTLAYKVERLIREIEGT